jgi:hypothetical protein
MEERDPRGRRKLTPYSCPRCGYQTDRKGYMKGHLYDLKKECPSVIARVELTEDIKQDILKNRVYHIEDTPKPQSAFQIINNHNVITNFICGIDPLTKLQNYYRYYQKKPKEFEEMVDELYEEQSRFLEDYSGRHVVHYNQSHYMDMVDNLSDVSKCNENVMKSFNICYDDKRKKMWIYENESDGWMAYRYTAGVAEIIRVIALSLLHKYEIYLVKKLEYGDYIGYERARLEESLDHYFLFLQSFGVQPLCVDNSTAFEEMVFEHNEGRDDLSDKYISRMEKATQSTKKKQEIQKQVYQIVKTNLEQNIRELNKKIIEIAKVDQEFLKQLR